ncbi:MAG: hypothetical protein JRI23_15555 [Deltaproteobacteria bacterium]|jgi:hypothetical protein|nr:hypothetical protein [Deltaproteobacteria bacterium]MBW2533169.1 hypothetical protein [Deltaproteobacteria bacterium]
MLPPELGADALAKALEQLRSGALEPEARLDGIDVPLSQLVRIRMIVEQTGALEPVLARFDVDLERWREAEHAWGALLYINELRARYQFWSETLDVSEDVAALRR